MAIDTRDKRGSAIGFNKPFGAVYPNPDGAITSQADRQQAAYAYRGILAGGAAEGPQAGTLALLGVGK